MDKLELARKMWFEKYRSASGIPVVESNLPFKQHADDLLRQYKNVLDAHTELYLSLAATALQLANDPVKPAPALKLTSGQDAALKALLAWLPTREPYFVLRGYAGTGKTHVVSRFAQHLVQETSIFSAPTNKATKVLRKLMPGNTCRTIYSVLSLKMVEREDELVLEASDDRFNLSGYQIIVVDEASMLNSELLEYINDANLQFGIKFLFVCDDAQLPPVGESISPVLELECPNAKLTEVVRHDNQILEVATHVRKHITRHRKLTPVTLSTSDARCVWQLSGPAFVERIQQAAAKIKFVNVKAIAWRNKTVDRLNSIIRQQLYTKAELNTGEWLVGDQVVMTEPVGEGRNQVASTDDEGIVVESQISTDPENGFKCYFLAIKLENGTTIAIRVIHDDSLREFQRTLAMLAAEARKPNNGKMWGKFWELRKRYVNIRHSYAITAHRSQGSTFKFVFVDAGDILANPDKATAYRCLYVAVTRPSDRLYLTGFPR